jgi:hypothetical protein
MIRFRERDERVSRPACQIVKQLAPSMLRGRSDAISADGRCRAGECVTHRIREQQARAFERGQVLLRGIAMRSMVAHAAMDGEAGLRAPPQCNETALDLAPRDARA